MIAALTKFYSIFFAVAAKGVSNVKTAVLRIPKPRAYLPPNFSASIPLGR